MTDLSVRELPLFPLPDVVLFPQEVLPLHIFELRYRLMLKSVLDSDRRFGVVRWDPEQKAMASIGCCAEILQCQTQADERSNLVTIGQQRFRLLNVVREAPFMVGLVCWLEDEPVEVDLQPLANNVRQALQDVVDLSGKLLGQQTVLPNDLPELPRELSFWVGGHLGGAVADHQQQLLEMTSTSDRLQRELDLLDHTRR
ncbi:LON peptidase substrate-binding domain-containing protein, partial [Synechococcus lacustris]